MCGRVAIVGASVRAAAFSTLREGLLPVGIDLFADWDLVRRVTAIRVSEYPDGFAAALAGQDVEGWFYTGGLENHPELVDRMAAFRPLWGNAGATLRAVRDPFQCARAWNEVGVACPALTRSPQRISADGSWLEKPLHGSGGAGIRVWREAARDVAGLGKYFQKHVPGMPCSAVFVGAQGRCVLLGATWQLVGTAWTGAGKFCYAGSIGPIEPRAELDDQWQRIGGAIAQQFQLAGLFGVDGVLDGGELWPIEVNPRYPASVEVLERALGLHAVGMHVDACRRGRLPAAVPRTSTRWCGKAVHYASADVLVAREFEAFAAEEATCWPWPNLADVPHPGTWIRRTRPVATVLAEAPDEESLRGLLRDRMESLQRALYR